MTAPRRGTTRRRMATPLSRPLARVRLFSSMVTLAHTVFALPFAASAVLLALARPHVPLSVARALAMLFCMATARTAAMSYNRYLDRDIDAQNPRTRGREIPAGRIAPRTALTLAAAMSVLFVAGAAALGRWPMLLAPAVLLVLLGYSWTKRFTWTSHLVLGLSLALAPGGAWIAMGARPEPAIVALMAGVLTWTAGFDVLYSLQDEAFDRAHDLHSIPARFGTLGAVGISASLHVAAVVAFAACGVWLERGPMYFAGVVLIAALLAYEHAIVGRGNLEKIDRAFFDVNGYVSCGFLLLTAGDAWALAAR